MPQRRIRQAQPAGTSQERFSDEEKFFVFCVEHYKAAENLSGKEAFNLLSEPRVKRFIIDNFYRLHIQGTKQTIKEIKDEIVSRNAGSL